MSTNLAGEMRLGCHFTVLAYPFRHASVRGRKRKAVLAQLEGRWQPWWARFDEGGLQAALNDTYFFLPYIRELLFPEAVRQPSASFRIPSLSDLADEGSAESALRLTYHPEKRAALQRLELASERKDATCQQLVRFDAAFDVQWIDAVLFPHGIGFLLLKVQLAEEQPTVHRLRDALSYLRLVHPPTESWETPSWHQRGSDEPRWRSRDLVDFLLQGLTEAPDRQHGSLRDWLADPLAVSVGERDTASPFGQVQGQVFHLFSYACLTGTSEAAPEPGQAGLFASHPDRALYELATCTDTSVPDNLPHPSYLQQLWRHNRVAFWDNWQGLVLHDNVVFLGLRDGPFLHHALPHNMESDYFPLYLFTLFQKIWLSITFGEMVRPDVGSPRNTKAARRLWDALLLFQNRFWFVEVTRKPLPVELFRLYQHGLGVVPLYEELSEQAADLHTYHEQKAARRMSRLMTSLYCIVLPSSVLGTLFGYRLIEQGLWLQALAVVGILYVMFLSLWSLWNFWSRE